MKQRSPTRNVKVDFSWIEERKTWVVYYEGNGIMGSFPSKYGFNEKRVTEILNQKSMLVQCAKCDAPLYIKEMKNGSWKEEDYLFVCAGAFSDLLRGCKLREDGTEMEKVIPTIINTYCISPSCKVGKNWNSFFEADYSEEEEEEKGKKEGQMFDHVIGYRGTKKSQAESRKYIKLAPISVLFSRKNRKNLGNNKFAILQYVLSEEEIEKWISILISMGRAPFLDREELEKEINSGNCLLEEKDAFIKVLKRYQFCFPSLEF